MGTMRFVLGDILTLKAPSLIIPFENYKSVTTG